LGTFCNATFACGMEQKAKDIATFPRSNLDYA